MVQLAGYEAIQRAENTNVRSKGQEPQGTDSIGMGAAAKLDAAICTLRSRISSLEEMMHRSICHPVAPSATPTKAEARLAASRVVSFLYDTTAQVEELTTRIEFLLNSSEF